MRHQDLYDLCNIKVANRIPVRYQDLYDLCNIKIANRIPVRYQDGFSRKVQFISSEESGQSMFKSHLSSNLAGRANGNSQMKSERMINSIEDQLGPRSHPMHVPSLQLKLSSLHGVRFSSVSSFPWMQSS